MIIYAPRVSRLLPLIGNANLPDHLETPEDAAKEIRRIWKLPRTCDISVPSEDYPSALEVRRYDLHPKSYRIKTAAINDIIGGHGIEAVETENTGEWLECINVGDPYVPTVIWWRGALSLRDGGLGGFLETCRVKFK
jgi:hypothetical protein